MPNKQSAIKALRQTQKRTIKNAKEKLLLTGLLRRSRKALVEKKEDARMLISTAVKALDKAAQHRVIKPNKAARLKSRLMKRVNAKS